MRFPCRKKAGRLSALSFQRSRSGYATSEQRVLLHRELIAATFLFAVRPIMKSSALFCLSCILVFSLIQSVSSLFSTLGESRRPTSQPDSSPSSSRAVEDFPEAGTGETLASAGTAALDVVPLPPCQSEARVAYPNGAVLHRTRTDSDRECCELCRDEYTDCGSWYRNSRTRRCILNSDIPNRRNWGRNFVGGSTI